MTAASTPVIASGSYAGDSDTAITVSFTVDSSGSMCSTTCAVAIWFGAHVSAQYDWGLGNGAGAIPGSPYHVALDAIDGASVGQRDNQMQAGAVIPNGTIVIVKDAVPNDAQNFSFNLTNGGTVSQNFSLDDDADPTLPNSQLFSVPPGTWTASELNIPSGWALSNLTCVDPSNNTTVSLGTATATINLSSLETVTCTFTDSLQQGTLTVIKHVVNDNGGTATADAWSLAVKSGGNNVSGSPQPGSETGTSYTLMSGTYVVSESGGPSGYAFTGFSGDCDSSGNVTVVAGQTKTCTLTNNDIAPKLHLRKVVMNDNGGTATVADFTLTADGTGSNDLSGTSPVDSGAGLQADTWALSETSVAGYTASAWSCVGGTQNGSNITVGIGGEATCTVTNDDQAASITVYKTVVNDNGGTAQPDDFNLTLEGTPVSSGVTVNVAPGTYTAGETLAERVHVHRLQRRLRQQWRHHGCARRAQDVHADQQRHRAEAAPAQDRR